MANASMNLSKTDDARCVFKFFRKNLSFEWEIGDVSKLQLNSPKLSPEISLMKEYTWYLELERTSLYYVLLNLCNTRGIKVGVEFTVTVSENRGKSFYCNSDLISDFEIVKKVNLISNIKLPVSLKNDMLLFTCSMKIHNLRAGKKSMFERTPSTTACEPELEALRKLSFDLKNIFHQNRNTDISLRIGHNVMKAHKTILRARSPVFEKMFEHETSEIATNIIDITDIKVSIMKKLLDYMYAGTCENGDFQDTCDLYYAADKYEVLELRSACRSALMDNLEVDSACTLLMLAHKHGDNQFEDDVIKFIGENFKSIVETESWEYLIDEDTKLAGRLIRFCARVMSN